MLLQIQRENSFTNFLSMQCTNVGLLAAVAWND